MKEKLKKQNGITLIALIISIIVMLILAMVSINIIMNQGIMTKSKTAADQYNQKAEEEQEELTFFERLLGKYNGEKVLPKWWDETESTINSNGEYWELTDEEKAEIEAAGMHEEYVDGEGVKHQDIYWVVAHETEEKIINIYEVKSEDENFKGTIIAIMDNVSNDKSYVIYDVSFSEVGAYANKWYNPGDNPGDNPIEYTGEFPIDISEIPEESIYSKTYLKRLVENFNKPAITSDAKYIELTDEEKTEIEAAGKHMDRGSEGIHDYYILEYILEEQESGVIIFAQEKPGDYKALVIIVGNNGTEQIYQIIDRDDVDIKANKWYKIEGEQITEYNGELPIDISQIPEESIYCKTALERLVENFNK